MNHSKIGAIFGSVLVSVLLAGCGGASDSTPAVVAGDGTPTLSAISSQSTNQSVIKTVKTVVKVCYECAMEINYNFLEFSEF